ncbi:MAG: hypothetical protein JWQ20_3846 [Conexibacter sp.]|nr:hypothetical protein [Conexibacter sp.]
MRFGVVLQAPWADEAARAEALGFDLVWLDERDVPAPLVVAAGIAPRTRGVRLAVCVDGGPHPVALAEDAITADLASGGRLVLVVRGDDEDLLAETVDVLHLAFAARPFRHDGVHWRIPAGLPEHDVDGTRLRVSPAPAQLELPVWTAGPAGAAVARDRGIAHVAGHGEPLQAGGLRARRPKRYATDGDPRYLVDTLRGEDAPDLAVLDVTGANRAEQLRVIATQLRPRVQLDALPPGLEAYWG